MSVQPLSVRDIYTTAATRTPTTSARATPGATPGRTVGTPESATLSPDLARVFATPGNGLAGVLVLALFTVALAFIARRVEGPEEFKSIKLSPYNLLQIGLMASLGILLWKVVTIFVAARVPVLAPVAKAFAAV